MKQLQNDLHELLHSIWGKTSINNLRGEINYCFAYGEDTKAFDANIESLAKNGYIKDLVDLSNNHRRNITGKLTNKGQNYCEEYFGNIGNQN